MTIDLDPLLRDRGAMIAALRDAGAVIGTDDNHIRSPWRDDKTGSLSLFEKSGLIFVKDHGNGEKAMTIIGVVARTHGVSNREAMTKAVEIYGNGSRTRSAEIQTGRKRPFSQLRDLTSWIESKTRARCTRTDVYRDGDGKELMVVCRFDDDRGNKSYRPAHRVKDGWSVGDPKGLLPLFNLNLLAGDSHSPVLVGEGEKVANALTEIGFLATTSSHGSQSPQKTDWSPLAGRKVTIFPDFDEPGKKYARAVSEILSKLDHAPEIQIADPELFKTKRKDQGADVADLIDEMSQDGRSKAEIRVALEKIIADAKPVRESVPSHRGTTTERKTQATKLVELAQMAELFHGPGADAEAYASITADGHTENFRVRSAGFRQWLVRQYYYEYQAAPNNESVGAALNVIDSEAIFNGKQIEVAMRVAEYENNIFMDLGDSSWSAVEITPDGWNVIQNPPVRFIRSKGMLPLPIPNRDGRIADLRPCLNMVDDEHWALYQAALVGAYHPSGPYIVLVIQGEQGSAKTTASSTFRALTDPNVVPLRSEPRDIQDLMLMARNSRLLAFDNLSRVPIWLSDALCRLSTGGGFSTRELYSNTEEVLFHARRPTLINGIDDIIDRGDLLDRCCVLTLPPIRDEERRSEKEVQERFEQVKPSVLGAVFSAISHGLREIGAVVIDELPRMADFARWVVACEQLLDVPSMSFLESYRSNRQGLNQLAVEGSELAEAIGTLVKNCGSWNGTAKSLLEQLNEQVAEEIKNRRWWPKSPKGMGGKLRRLAPSLRGRGVVIEFFKGGDRNERLISISRSGSPIDAAPEEGEEATIPF